MNRELGQDLDYQNVFLFETLLNGKQRFRTSRCKSLRRSKWRFRASSSNSVRSMWCCFPMGMACLDLYLGRPVLTYVGCSMGCVHGSAFLTYAPEIKAAAIAAGAQRQAEAYSTGTFIDKFLRLVGADAERVAASTSGWSADLQRSSTTRMRTNMRSISTAIRRRLLERRRKRACCFRKAWLTPADSFECDALAGVDVWTGSAARADLEREPHPRPHCRAGHWQHRSGNDSGSLSIRAAWRPRHRTYARL